MSDINIVSGSTQAVETPNIPSLSTSDKITLQSVIAILDQCADSVKPLAEQLEGKGGYLTSGYFLECGIDLRGQLDAYQNAAWQALIKSLSSEFPASIRDRLTSIVSQLSELRNSADSIATGKDDTCYFVSTLGKVREEVDSLMWDFGKGPSTSAPGTSEMVLECAAKVLDQCVTSLKGPADSVKDFGLGDDYKYQAIDLRAKVDTFTASLDALQGTNASLPQCFSGLAKDQLEGIIARLTDLRNAADKIARNIGSYYDTYGIWDDIRNQVAAFKRDQGLQSV